MIGIKTKYVGPSNFKGSRIAAVADSGEKVFIHYDSALDSEKNHEMARNILAKKIGFPNLKWSVVNFKGELFHGGVSA